MGLGTCAFRECLDRRVRMVSMKARSTRKTPLLKQKIHEAAAKLTGAAPTPEIAGPAAAKHLADIHALSGGGELPPAMAELKDALDDLAKDQGWDTPEVQQAMASGTYRAAGFVITDEVGYDRELAKSSVGPGWASLIDEVYDAKPDWIRIEQVKEKYAGLRIYFGSVNARYDEASREATETAWNIFDQLIDAVEERSYTMCEECGQPGVVRDGSWLVTSCDEHAKGRVPLPPRGA